MKCNLRQIAGLVIAVAAFAAPPGLASAAMMDFFEGDEPTLAQLEDGGTITVGDKVFSNFVYTSQPDTPNADQIIVEGFENEDTGEIGLLFNIAFAAGVLGPPVLDASLLFTVEILDPNLVFESASLTGTLGVPTTDGNSGVAGIEETIVADPGNESFGLLIEDNVLDGIQGPVNESDTVFFPETSAFTRLDIVKDIFVQAGDDQFDRARLTTFTQVFTQRPIIPEPSTMCLAALALSFGGSIAMRNRLG